jgi:nitric-oxide synthase
MTLDTSPGWGDEASHARLSIGRSQAARPACEIQARPDLAMSPSADNPPFYGTASCPRSQCVQGQETTAMAGQPHTTEVDSEVAAWEFLRLFEQETSRPPDPARAAAVAAEIRQEGFYRQTGEELAFACRVAWRNNGRCIGRNFWETLAVHDHREARTAGDLFECCVEHLRWSTNQGKIRPLITIFAPERSGQAGPRILNRQLIAYAGYRNPDGTVLGDPAETALTDEVLRLGWHPPVKRTAFDVLPLVIECHTGAKRLFKLPPDAVLEVPLEHPNFPWFAELGLRWYALPVVSNMILDTGGVRYPAAPFSGFYMETEIAARNLSDKGRYNVIPEVTKRMKNPAGGNDSLSADRALIELCAAVLYSFRRDGVTIIDHHAASRQFMEHHAAEQLAGRAVPGDWSWLVPPVSGSLSPVFHHYYDSRRLLPNFLNR